MERRVFLALPATLAAGGLAAAQAQAPWHQRVRRIGQLNANERDPADLDVKAWADYWASLKVDEVLVSVRGIVAFYPTKLPNFGARRFSVIGTSLASAARPPSSGASVSSPASAPT